MKKKNTKTFFWLVIILTISLLFLSALLIVIVDPLMHYHKPFESLSYVMKDEFYLNPGIAAHYDYDGIIVGDSSCQNFLPSELNETFGINAIKLTNMGAPFSESDEILRYAYSKNPDIKMVIRPVDSLMIASDPDMRRYPKEDYYLYDNNIFNDVKYIFNIESLKKCFTIFVDTYRGKMQWNMDMYSNWEDFRDFNNQEILEFTLGLEPTVDYSDKEKCLNNARENVSKYIIETCREHPESTFYIFIPPYHLAYYKTLINAETFDLEFEIQKEAIELLLQEDNIILFSFADDYEITTDWYYYCDMVHSRQCVNSRIFESMFNNDHRVTKDNYLDYLKEIKEFYSSYDYDSLIEE